MPFQGIFRTRIDSSKSQAANFTFTVKLIFSKRQMNLEQHETDTPVYDLLLVWHLLVTTKGNPSSAEFPIHVTFKLNVVLLG
jgi:hypothetical protein